MRRPIAAGIAAAVLILFAAFHFRFQKPGTARIVRSGDGTRTITAIVGWAPPYRGESCIAPMERGSVLFRKELSIVDVTGQPIPIEIRFGYEPPARLPLQWPRGTWCESLRAFLDGEVARWFAAANRDDVLRDPRAAAWNLSAALTRHLARGRIVADKLSARLRLPPALASTSSIAEIAAATSQAPPVIFIGMDGADWQLLDHYIQKGAMPVLAQLRREGVSGILDTEPPALSPLLWNTMMTGRSPLDHQILDFTRFHPQTRVKEPITADMRRVPAIWNMATYGGKDVAAFGLWATYPAEPVRGTLVSDRFFTFLFSEASPPPGVVFPPALEQRARHILQSVEKKIDFARVKDYLPWLEEAEYNERIKTKDPYGHPVSALRRILIETELYDELASEVLARRQPALSLIYLQGTDTVGHVFAAFTAPRQPEVSEEDFKRYSHVPERYFRYVDSLLAKYRDRARKSGGVLMLASDHGFHWFEDRPTRLSSFAAATAAKWHRREGMYLLWGKGIAPAAGARGGIARVCGTLLALAGLPPGEHLAGPPLSGAPPVTRPSVDYAAHYKPVPAVRTEAAQAAEEIAKLRALGYIGSGEAAQPAAGSAAGVRTAGSFNNEGIILREQRKQREAMAAFERAITIDPNLASALWNLSDMLFARYELERADELLLRSFANDLPDGRKYLIGRAIGYQRAGQPGRSLKLLEAAVAAKPEDAELRMFRGRYRIELRDCAGALDDFLAAERLQPANPVPFASAGIAEMCLGRSEAAQRSFAQSLRLDPNQPTLRRYLAR
jgi:Flp pilus assembly protein TadD